MPLSAIQALPGQDDLLRIEMSGLGKITERTRFDVYGAAVKAALLGYELKAQRPGESPSTTASYVAWKYVQLAKDYWTGELKPEKLLEDPNFDMAVKLAAPGSKLRGAQDIREDEGRGLLAGKAKWVVIGLAAAAAGYYFWSKRQQY